METFAAIILAINFTALVIFATHLVTLRLERPKYLARYMKGYKEGRMDLLEALSRCAIEYKYKGIYDLAEDLITKFQEADKKL